jgi:hypothetical protein
MASLMLEEKRENKRDENALFIIMRSLQTSLVALFSFHFTITTSTTLLHILFFASLLRLAVFFGAHPITMKEATRCLARDGRFRDDGRLERSFRGYNLFLSATT